MDNLIENYFQNLNSEAIPACNDQAVEATTCPQCLSHQYFNGNEISYSCENKRKLYVLRYLPTHSVEIYQGATKIPSDVVNSWFESGYVKILSIGGGPGSDVVGILKFLREESERRGFRLNIDVVQVDIEDQWNEIFDDVIRRLFPNFCQCRKVRLDVEDRQISTVGNDFNLVTVSYLTSELDTQACLNLADDINSILIDGGILMINDRPEDSVELNIQSMFNQICIAYKQESLTEWAGIHYPPNIANEVAPKLKMNSSIFIGAK